MAEFSNSINKWIDKVKGRETDFFREFSQEIAFQVIMKTPVDTGFARASWYTLINQDDGQNPNQPDRDQFELGGLGGAAAAGKAQGDIVLSLLDAEIGDVITILNNAEYIQRLEDGSSQQAPSGMVKTTLNDADAIAKRVISRLGNV